MVTKTIQIGGTNYTLAASEYRHIFNLVLFGDVDQAAKWWSTRFQTKFDYTKKLLLDWKATALENNVFKPDPTVEDVLVALKKGFPLKTVAMLQFVGEFCRMYKILTGRELFYKCRSDEDQSFELTSDHLGNAPSINIDFQYVTPNEQNWIITFSGMEGLFDRYPEFVGVLRPFLTRK